jgi:ABC-type transporter MlaC component
MRELIALGGTSPKNKLIQRISSVLRRRANTQSISLFALGTYRRQLPKNLVNDYVGATINYAAATFAEYVKEFEGAKFKVKTAQKSGKETIISGDVTYAGGKTREVRFKIAGGPSRPRVMDVNVQGLWLSLQLRKMFTDELKRNRGNFEVFIDWLKWITK